MNFNAEFPNLVSFCSLQVNMLYKVCMILYRGKSHAINGRSDSTHKILASVINNKYVSTTLLHLTTLVEGPTLEVYN